VGRGKCRRRERQRIAARARLDLPDEDAARGAQGCELARGETQKGGAAAGEFGEQGEVRGEQAQAVVVGAGQGLPGELETAVGEQARRLEDEGSNVGPAFAGAQANLALPGPLGQRIQGDQQQGRARPARGQRARTGARRRAQDARPLADGRWAAAPSPAAQCGIEGGHRRVKFAEGRACRRP
jgi:hypothetical protein